MSAASNSNKIVLITGATRGIGLGLTEVYAKNGWRVVATARDESKAADLQALSKTYKNVSIVQLTADDSKSVAALPAQLAAIGVTGIDLLYNNAGIMSGDASVSGVPSLETETVKNFLDVYRTNVVGVWEVTKVLKPLIRAAASKAARIVNVSSIMGSVDATLEGPWPGQAGAYRASKAALNELSAVQAREYNAESVKAAADSKAAASAEPLITVVALHPGWVETDLGKSAGKPPTTVLQSVTGIEKVISGVKTNAKAVFLDFEGNTVKW